MMFEKESGIQCGECGCWNAVAWYHAFPFCTRCYRLIKQKRRGNWRRIKRENERNNIR